jgi:hypothetical protein
MLYVGEKLKKHEILRTASELQYDYHFSNTYQSIFGCHSEALKPKRFSFFKEDDKVSE